MQGPLRTLLKKAKEERERSAKATALGMGPMAEGNLIDQSPPFRVAPNVCLWVGGPTRNERATLQDTVIALESVPASNSFSRNRDSTLGYQPAAASNSAVLDQGLVAPTDSLHTISELCDLPSGLNVHIVNV